MAGYSMTNADMSREVRVEHGDGTATVTRYAPDGTVVDVETITGLPVVEADLPAVDPLHQLAQAIVDATTLDDIKPTALAILTDGDTP